MKRSNIFNFKVGKNDEIFPMFDKQALIEYIKDFQKLYVQ